MANVMSTEKRNTILRHLVEGNSIRSTCRLMGTNIPSVLRQLEWAGKHCAALLNDRLQGLKCRHLEVDEIWTYCAKKQANLTIEERTERHDIGDLYLFTAQDQDSRLIAHYLLGKRSADNTRRFMVQLADNMTQPNGGYGCPQISVDGFPAYPEAVDLAFGKDCKLGVIIKEYRNSRLKYDPSEIVGTKRKRMRGAIEDRSICTSHVERNNLTIRTFMKRFNRLTIGFSRKIENLEAAVNLHVAYFNFCWRPGEMKVTPAQAAGLTDHTAGRLMNCWPKWLPRQRWRGFFMRWRVESGGMHPILNLKAPELYIAVAMILLAFWLRRFRPNFPCAILRQSLRIGSMLLIVEMLWRTRADWWK